MTACCCSESKRPLILPAGSNRPPRRWFVTRRNYSCSALNGYHQEWSDYSDVRCGVCGSHWRTKAAFVGMLEDCKYFPEKEPPKLEALED